MNFSLRHIFYFIKMKIRYNSPTILTFSLLCALISFLNQFTEGSLIQQYFTLPGRFNSGDPVNYWRMFSYTLGHANWDHLVGNLSLILLVGPALEEKYGGKKILLMMLATALITSGVHVFLFDSGLLGASGIVFMFILLSSFSNHNSDGIPVTLILIFVIFLLKEIMNTVNSDQISQFAHIMGGLLGILFGFRLRR